MTKNESDILKCLSELNCLDGLLKKKGCFKLICGAGNENLQEVERLVALYAKAGCRFFDFAASKEVLKAAQRGLDFAVKKEEQVKYHFCVSIGTKNDQHVQKAFIDREKCVGCGKCVEICPQGAIDAKRKTQNSKSPVELPHYHYEVVEKNCIGCLKCQKICDFDAINSFSKNKPFSLSTFQPFNLSCIELHASDTDEQEVDEIWDYLNKNFEGMLSLCLGRKNLSDEKILSRVKRLVETREPYKTIIQADGVPMSGGADDFESTRPAVEMGKLIQSANLPVHLLLSGGTNSKTSELARIEKVNISGVAVGSYARKIVKEYIERVDFWESKEVFEEALKIAKDLVESPSK